MCAMSNVALGDRNYLRIMGAWRRRRGNSGDNAIGREAWLCRKRLTEMHRPRLPRPRRGDTGGPPHLYARAERRPGDRLMPKFHFIGLSEGFPRKSSAPSVF